MVRRPSKQKRVGKHRHLSLRGSAKESKTVGNGLLEMSSTSSHFTDVKRVLGHLIGYRNELEQYKPQEHKN